MAGTLVAAKETVKAVKPFMLRGTEKYGFMQSCDLGLTSVPRPSKALMCWFLAG